MSTWNRRAWIGAAGLAGAGGLAAYAYRIAPSFWKRYAQDLKRPILPPSAIPAPNRWPERGVHAAWLGHSTVLLRIDGFTILTDPVFSERAGLRLGPITLGVKRLVAPPLAASQLPPIDLLLLSHAHMDHFDLPSLRELENRRVAVVTAASTSDLLRTERWARVTELGWNQSVQIGPARFSAFKVNHWGARMRSDVHRGYNGYVIEVGRYRVLFAGDTAVTDAFRDLRGARPYDLAIMPIGAYDPWIRYHCTPEQAWRMANDARADIVLPVHHQTFPLSREPVFEPIERLAEAAANHQERIAVRRVGQEFTAPA
jgi:L-ascorbate metabolism protein UlaG (beta-lactamase superfamily)